jgi:hypothetical protein
VDLKDTQKLALPGVRHDVPSFTTYLSRYDVQHLPSSPAVLNSATVASSEILFNKLINHFYL